MSEQKLIGVVLIALSIMMIVLTKDGTAAAVFIPLGIYCLVTRNCIIGGKNAKKRKTHDEWEIQGDYGYGWEMLTTADSSAEAASLLQDYDENDVFPHRIVKRRVKNER